MCKETVSQEIRLKNIDETRNYSIQETNRYELVSKKHQIFRATLNYIERSLILAFAVTGYVSISAFSFLLGIPIGITSSAIGLKLCAITAGIKKYKSIIKKKKKNHDKILLLPKSKLNSIEVVVSKSLIDSVISHNDLINDVIREYNEIKEEEKN